MITQLKEALWQQFGASITMLENSVNACPDALWDGKQQFWYNVYHCLFFLEYYLTLAPANFTPPAPFTLSEFEDTKPERVYTKQELLVYLKANRQKCYFLINGLTEEQATSYWINASKTMQYSIIEILLYNMRHVQHHTAQLNQLLRQNINHAPDWVFRADESFNS